MRPRDILSKTHINDVWIDLKDIPFSYRFQYSYDNSDVIKYRLLIIPTFLLRHSDIMFNKNGYEYVLNFMKFEINVYKKEKFRVYGKHVLVNGISLINHICKDLIKNNYNVNRKEFINEISERDLFDRTMKYFEVKI